mgnify:FL=1
MQRIKKGDKVRLISGDQATQEGIVLSVNPKHGTAIVEGLNIVKKHKKASNDNSKGGIVNEPAPIKLSKLALVVVKAPHGISKVTYRIDKTGKKVRFAKKTNSEINQGKKK